MSKKITTKVSSLLEKLRSIPHQNIFLLLALLCGLLLICINPLFKVPDEVRHFYRAYQVSTGQVLPIKSADNLGGILPSSIVNIERDYGSSKPTKDPDSIFVSFPNTAIYSPANYIAPSLGMFLGRAFHASPTALATIGRLSNLFLYILIVFISIKLTPKAKLFLSVLALNPATLQLAASLSPDAIIDAMAIFTIAYILHLLDREYIGRREITWMLLIAILLGLLKQPMFLLSIMFLALPVKLFAPMHRFKYYALIISPVFISLILSALWSLLMMHFFVPTRTDIPIQPFQQLIGIVHNPASFIVATLKTIYHLGFITLWNFIAGLRYEDLIVPTWATITGFFAIIGSFIISRVGYKQWFNTLKQVRRVKLLACLTAILFIGFTILLMYMSWNPVGSSSVIQGLQSRYYFPVLALFAFLLAKQNHTTRYWQASAVLYSAILLVNIVAMQTIYGAYNPTN